MLFLGREQNILNDLMLGTKTKAHLPAILFALCYTPVENVPTLMIVFAQSQHPSLSLIKHTSVRLKKVFSLRLYSNLLPDGVSVMPRPERGAGCGIRHLLSLQ